MLLLKKLFCVGLLFSALIIPTSAFAESLNDSTSSENKIQTLINSFLTSLGCEVGGYANTFEGKKVNFSDWWEKNKKDCPTQDSAEIWQEWYCGDFPGLGKGVGGTPSEMEGEGQFPGQGNGYGWQKWDAGH